MGLYFNHNFGFNIIPQPQTGTKVSVAISHFPLMFSGLNMQAHISTASAYLHNPNFDKNLCSSITIIAHLDTGASRTSIDIKLAKQLKLLATGISTNKTASGLERMPTFSIDLNFPNTSLSPFINLPIGSCNLDFSLEGKLNDPKNFGILIGRDILSFWNIIWNGPTSTVFIND